MRTGKSPHSLLATGVIAVIALLMLRTEPDAVLHPALTAIPSTVSAEAHELLAREYTPAKRRALVFPTVTALDKIRQQREREIAGELPSAHPSVAAFAPTLARKTIGGIPALEITPVAVRDARKAVVYLHGGGYVLGTASNTLDLSVPLADASGYRVIAVDYTTAPAKDFRGITAEVVTVMKALLAEGAKPGDIAFFGDSAGGALAAGSILRMREEGVPLPAALLAWSPWSDIEPVGDTYTTLADSDPFMRYDLILAQAAAAYAPALKDRKNPWVSPVYGNFKPGFPPTLVQVGTKEIFLSNAVRLVTALDNAGIDARLDATDGMPHVFQRHWELPEAKAAIARSAHFLRRHLEPQSDPQLGKEGT